MQGEDLTMEDLTGIDIGPDLDAALAAGRDVRAVIVRDPDGTRRAVLVGDLPPRPTPAQARRPLVVNAAGDGYELGP